MRLFFILAIVLASLTFAFGQNEQSPIVQKDIEYRDWTYKRVTSGEEINLRKFIDGKKLVMVVYFAPWCGNWRHDLPFVQSMYNKYHDKGFDVIAVGEYDPVDSMKSHVSQFKLTFPVVSESDARTAKQTTLHYQYRQSSGDTRNWGSPWYIFLDPTKLETKGDLLLTSAPVVNGELIQAEAEKFIKEKVGAKPGDDSKLNSSVTAEPCDPAKPSATNLVKPSGKP